LTPLVSETKQSTTAPFDAARLELVDGESTGGDVFTT